MPIFNIKVIFVCLFFITSINNILINNKGRTLEDLFNRISKKIYLREYIIKKNNTTPFVCPFDRENKKTTFDCIKRKWLKYSNQLFSIWSNSIPKIHVNEKLEREQINTENSYSIRKKLEINKNFNYFDLSTLNTYCNFYKLCIADLVNYYKQNNGYNNYHLGKIKKRYFVKSHHLNSDPLEEESYIFIIGQKKEKLRIKSSIYDKIRNSVNNTIYYYYLMFMNKILYHTFYLVYNPHTYDDVNNSNDWNSNNNGNFNNTQNSSNYNFIIYKNKIIYPFKSTMGTASTPYKNHNTNNSCISDFYLIEICHCLNGITYKQSIYSLLKNISKLYFKAELVSYILQLPPVFYHILIIIICSIICSYIFYKIFLKYKINF
ncbi:conserved Plasmodium protein, unknown function [Plasmodium berghei]|uniref:Uncharacterized protein n=2 Tax=Plasmodium berghei TaxID=5821 RepID=A0A509AMF1_PLABA|nr:conserved Plasmodium protein, unknown function [Plasmodium berghei ANKA]CXI67836.1 conserved Plasmodium protein, unknown function [Plasmodium berghei]SCM24160.1 conserved Plasmodium protein, unknown function [Plasmodium berghei]SCN26956.1 conserved Plasmodium protein, unknown function [Plasmodium berghei]SCO61400.1 conserved Plasmodium protein, unknown function [Plasmodium berghei]SCO63377.1 conserved Plasmodium protein, unknown function [Plasmodium berghei]|eukprot:XP_034422572.1 conserved Plasmodium protein, unknown function [Plasmodium berghei ANKA]